jgi:hypothetical protein
MHVALLDRRLRSVAEYSQPAGKQAISAQFQPKLT